MFTRGWSRGPLSAGSGRRLHPDAPLEQNLQHGAGRAADGGRVSEAPRAGGGGIHYGFMGFPVHPHMLRHGCGFKLANDGHATRTIQHYLGYKNIQHTVRYAELSSDRFKGFGKD